MRLTMLKSLQPFSNGFFFLVVQKFLLFRFQPSSYYQQHWLHILRSPITNQTKCSLLFFLSVVKHKFSTRIPIWFDNVVMLTIVVHSICCVHSAHETDLYICGSKRVSWLCFTNNMLFHTTSVLPIICFVKNGNW